MARLINPGTGDLLDRLSILSLKILHAGLLAGKNVDHFRNERNALLTMVRAGGGSDKVIEEYQQLGAVNAALWYAEDELRHCRFAHQQEPLGTPGLIIAVQCAFKIQSLNDERARLIGEINKKSGTDLGAEKLT